MEKYYKLKNILSFLVTTLRKQDFLVYFKKMTIVDVAGDELILGVVSSFMRDNIAAKFYDNILEAAKTEFPNVKRIDFIVDPNIENPTNHNVVDCVSLFKDSTSKKKPKKEEENPIVDKNQAGFSRNTKTVNDRYSLENFIVGPDNQLAYSACEAVTRNPGKSYNPLYIYGDVGLGKTHLLQATGNAISKKFKDKNIAYTTADKFITDYVSAVKRKSVEKLREKYKEIDVLIIDDVQFLAKKEQTQNELYNIFNILYDGEKQIIISGDRPPNELSELEPRLKSRFAWGITVDIGKPDYETRLAIIQEKSRAREFLLPKDVSEFVAANVTDNVRELEGVLNQIIAEFELDGSTPTLDRVAKKLKKLSFTGDLLGFGHAPAVNKIKLKSYEDVIDAVSAHFGIEKEGILGENRRKEFMIPRQVSMYLLKTKMNYTYERIGNIFSGRNHSAILYSCNKLDSIMKKDKNLLYEVNAIRESIGL
ncbi:MAG: chromosomal replication initiator protein DnaA [Candidatus Gracilibacteria bacterium]|nr:chromosomal replication initiator protein DnaA [Candidatus Gracilibacteria bacterium]